MTDSTYFWVADLRGTSLRLVNKVLAKGPVDAMASVQTELAGLPGSWRVTVTDPGGGVEIKNIEIMESEHGRS